MELIKKWNEKLEYSPRIFEHLKNMFWKPEHEKNIFKPVKSVSLLLSYLKQNNLERIKTM